MLNLIKWDKPLRVNGVVYNNSVDACKALKGFDGDVKVELNFKVVTPPQVITQQPTASQAQDNKQENSPVDEMLYIIKVRQYMTKHWDFNDKKNGGVPMPMRIMVGKVLEETKGMVKMELYAKPMPSSVCMACGRKLTHPVSLHYGIGPECGAHFHINPFGSEEELKIRYDELKQKMADVKWTGWIIKSAIEEKEELNENFSETVLAEVV